MNPFISFIIIEPSISSISRNYYSFCNKRNSINRLKQSIYCFFTNSSSFKNINSISCFTFWISIRSIKHITNCMTFIKLNIRSLSNTCISSYSSFIHNKLYKTTISISLDISFKSSVLNKKISIISIVIIFTSKIYIKSIIGITKQSSIIILIKSKFTTIKFNRIKNSICKIINPSIYCFSSKISCSINTIKSN